MSERENAVTTEEERRVQAALRALPTPAAAPDFRAELRERFVSGSIPEGAATRRPGRVVPMPWVGGIVAAAAVLAGLFFVLNRGSAWEFAGATGGGSVRVGEEIVPSERASELLPGRLRPGLAVRLEGEVQLDLVSPNVLAVQMAPGSEMTVPGLPGRWLGRSISCEVERGEVRFVTGPGFAGTRLVIGAPAAAIEVTGTTFAVIASSDSTCVCVLDGEVRMRGRDGVTEIVPAGKRRTVSGETGEAIVEEIFPGERMKLEMLRDRTGSGAPPP